MINKWVNFSIFIKISEIYLNKINHEKKLMIHITIDLLIFLAILLCYIYVVLSAYFVHRKCNYIHETTVSILLGVALGALIFSLTDLFTTHDYQTILRQAIILILLPPMLFEDGYNIRKRKFFQNILYINLYGVLGTIVHFLVMFGIFYGYNYFGLVRSINNEIIYLGIWQILAMSACLCSIDTVVAQKIVNPERYPKLFSIIFGQSILKDTITVTLFDSILNVYTKLIQGGSQPQFNPSSVGFMILKFAEVIVCSILIGTICGLITTFLFKNLRFLIDQKGVAEVALIMLTGYVSYILSQWGTFSGVISMLFCGITLSHFNVYNLTNEGKVSAKIAVSALAKVAEGLLFFLLGAFIFGIQIDQQSDQTVDYTFSWTLLLICLTTVLIARFINIYLMTLLGYLVVGRDKWRLNVYEYQILVASGLVKGAIPFALILQLPRAYHSFSTASIQNAIILVVFITSLFLNSILPKFLRNRLNKIDQMIRTHQNHPSLYDSLLIQYQQIEAQQKQQDKFSNFDSNKTQSNKQSQLSARLQSKKQLQKMALMTKLKSTTQKYWRRCQQGFLKPMLIYDYYNRKKQIKMQKIKARKQQAIEFWRKFTGQNILDPENQHGNKFIDVKLIENDQYSQDQDKKQIQQEQSELVCYIKKDKSKSMMEQQIPQIKSRSKTETIIISVKTPTEFLNMKQKNNLQMSKYQQNYQKDSQIQKQKQNLHMIKQQQIQKNQDIDNRIQIKQQIKSL